MNRKVQSLFVLVIGLLNTSSLIVEAESDLMWPKLRLPELGWTDDIRPGLSQSEIAAKLENMGIRFHERAGGHTYTSKIVIGERDYLFCRNHLFAIVEGNTVTDEEFTMWFQSFLSVHNRHGKPDDYTTSEELAFLRSVWNIDNKNTLYYQLQTLHTNKQT